MQVKLTTAQLYALAAHIPCDIVSARKWARSERDHMKPANLARLDRGARELGIPNPTEAPSTR